MRHWHRCVVCVYVGGWVLGGGGGGGGKYVLLCSAVLGSNVASTAHRSAYLNVASAAQHTAWSTACPTCIQKLLA